MWSPPFFNARFYRHLPEKYDYVGRLLKPGDEPSEYTDEEDIKDHLKHDWAVPSHRPKPGAPNSCDRPPPALLLLLLLHRSTRHSSLLPHSPKLFTSWICPVPWLFWKGRTQVSTPRPPSLFILRRFPPTENDWKPSRRAFFFLNDRKKHVWRGGKGGRGCAVRCIWNKTTKYFSHFSKRGKRKCGGRRWAPGGGWSEKHTGQRWSADRGNRFLSFYLLV